MVNIEAHYLADSTALANLHSVTFHEDVLHDWVELRLKEREVKPLGKLAIHLAGINSLEAILAPKARGVCSLNTNPRKISMFIPRMLDSVAEFWPEPDLEMQTFAMNDTANKTLVHELEHWVDSFYYPIEDFVDLRQKRYNHKVHTAASIYRDVRDDFTQDDVVRVFREVWEGVNDYMCAESYKEYRQSPHEVRARQAVKDYQDMWHPPIVEFELANTIAAPPNHG
jgi:hypothetical protein